MTEVIKNNETKNQLSNKEKFVLFSIMEKYDDLNQSFADSLSKVLQGKNTNEDLLNISQNMDYQDIDFEDSNELDKILGVQIGVACFNF